MAADGVKSFTTALTDRVDSASKAKAKGGKDEEQRITPEVTIEVDGRTVVLSGATTSEVALISLAIEAGQEQRAISTMVNVLFNLMKAEDQMWFRSRLFDRSDPFQFENIVDIAMYLTEAWAANPTEPSSTSSNSPPATGPRSTAKQRHRKASTS